MKNRTILFLLIVTMLGLSLLLVGCSGNNGTYYQVVDGKKDENNAIIIKGKNWESPSQYGNGVKGDFTLDGDQITLYMNVVGQKVKYLSGTLSEGVLKLGIAGTEQIYYKDGVVTDSDNSSGGENSNTGNGTSQQFVVSFNSLGGSFVDGALTNSNNLVSEPIAPTKDGYVFDGWFKDSQCTEKWNFATNKVTSNVTLYAKWAEQTYTVYFNSAGGSHVNDIVGVPYGSVINEPTNVTMSGYVLGGWFKDVQCTERWNFKTDKVTSNITLYAGWSVGLEYRLNDEQTSYAVVGLLDKRASSTALDVIIPEKYNSKPVTSIMQNAFCETGIKSVSIPDSVVDIGVGAFSHCTNLTSVTLGNGVKNIESNAFFNCPKLTEITVPSSVCSVGDSAFYNCGIKRVNISDIASWCNIDFGNDSASPISVYGAKLFLKNALIENVTFPDTVTEIKPYAFYAYPLNHVEMADSVKSIGEYAFANSSIQSVVIGNGVKSIGNNSFRGCYYLSKVTLGSGLQSIGDNTFSRSQITSIVIPEGVTDIGDSAFGNCNLLTRVSIPDSIKNLSPSAFWGTDNLQYNIYNGAKYLGNSSNPYVVLVGAVSQGITECTVHNGTKVIGESAFSGCDKLKSINFTGTVAQWNGITKGNNWYLYIPATKVICSDGEVAL